MTENHWDRVKAALEAVLAEKPANRAGFLKRLCGHEPELFEEVQSLLESYDDDYLESPAAPVSLAGLAETAKTAETPPPPKTIGPYRIVEKVGAGGMGEVYKVVDDEGRTFALKRLIRELVSDEGLARLRREASAASALEHPNIVKFVTLMEHEGAPHIVMEYLEGHTLKHVLSGERRLDLEDTLHVAIQVAEALACAHEKRDRAPRLEARQHSVDVFGSGEAARFRNRQDARDCAGPGVVPSRETDQIGRDSRYERLHGTRTSPGRNRGRAR